MKKLITIITLCAALMLFIAPVAMAADANHLDLCGTATVQSITLYETDAFPCDVVLDFTIGTQTYTGIPATAMGIQVNLALLKALNMSETVGICLRVNLTPFSAEVISVTAPAP